MNETRAIVPTSSWPGPKIGAANVPTPSAYSSAATAYPNCLMRSSSCFSWSWSVMVFGVLASSGAAKIRAR
jgi:hypothetical protein